MSAIGRPRILDDVKRTELCALLASGLELAEAAQSVGCSLRTVRRETARNDAFRRQLSNARLANRIDPVHHLRQAALMDWRAAAWLLERTNPGQFARRDRSGCDPQDLQTVVDRVIEMSLNEIDDHTTRTRVFRAASSVGRCAMETLFPPARMRRGPLLEHGLTPLLDQESLEEFIEQGPPSSFDTPQARRAAAFAERARTLLDIVKTPRPEDRTPACGAKSSPGSTSPGDAPHPPNSPPYASRCPANPRGF